MPERGRVLVALGGNAISPHGGAGTADEQVANVGRSMRRVAELVTDGWQVVLTHGNGPQVGDLVARDELNASFAPPYPLDWAVAETQATIGHVIANVLGVELERRGIDAAVVPVVSRVLVAGDDPAFTTPTKPIGPYLSDDTEARRRIDELGPALDPGPREGLAAAGRLAGAGREPRPRRHPRCSSTPATSSWPTAGAGSRRSGTTTGGSPASRP